MNDKLFTTIALHKDVRDQLKEYRKNFPHYSYGQVIEILLQRYSIDSGIKKEFSMLRSAIGDELSKMKDEIRELKHHVSLIQESLYKFKD